MTTLHAAAQRAMQALEHARDWIEGETNQPVAFYECVNAIEALRTALDHVPDAGKMVQPQAQPEPMSELDQELDAAASAEKFMRGRYGAMRGHYEWRALLDAHKAGYVAGQSAALQPGAAEPPIAQPNKATHSSLQEAIQAHIDSRAAMTVIKPVQPAKSCATCVMVDPRDLECMSILKCENFNRWEPK